MGVVGGGGGSKKKGRGLSFCPDQQPSACYHSFGSSLGWSNL